MEETKNKEDGLEVDESDLDETLKGVSDDQLTINTQLLQEDLRFSRTSVSIRGSWDSDHSGMDGNLSPREKSFIRSMIDKLCIDDESMEDLLFNLSDIGINWRLYNPIPCVVLDDDLSLSEFPISSRHILCFPVRALKSYSSQGKKKVHIGNDLYFILLKLRVKITCDPVTDSRLKFRTFRYSLGQQLTGSQELGFSEQEILRIRRSSKENCDATITLKSGQEFIFTLFNEGDRNALVELMKFGVEGSCDHQRMLLETPNTSASASRKTQSLVESSLVSFRKALFWSSLCYHQTMVRIFGTNSLPIAQKYSLMIFTDRLLFHSPFTLNISTKYIAPEFVIPVARVLRMENISDFRLSALEIDSSLVLILKKPTDLKHAATEVVGEDEFCKLTFLFPSKIECKRFQRVLEQFLARKVSRYDLGDMFRSPSMGGTLNDTRGTLLIPLRPKQHELSMQYSRENPQLISSIIQFKPHVDYRNVPTPSQWSERSCINYSGRSALKSIDRAIGHYQECINRYIDILSMSITVSEGESETDDLKCSLELMENNDEEIIQFIERYIKEHKPALVIRMERKCKSVDKKRMYIISPSIREINQLLYSPFLISKCKHIHLVCSRVEWLDTFRLALIYRYNGLMELDSCIRRWKLEHSRSHSRYNIVQALETNVHDEEIGLSDTIKSIPSHDLVKQRSLLFKQTYGI